MDIRISRRVASQIFQKVEDLSTPDSVWEYCRYVSIFVEKKVEM